ncbi:MAG: hypothetical protein J6B16_00685 [Clostridia bacterium]|nr:hypothetical protein [Clostridia bacterium]
MRKVNKILIGVLSAVILIISFFGGFAVSSCVNKSNELNWTVGMIYKHYYAIDPVTGEKITLTEEDFINAITYTLLDDYSDYYSPDELTEYEASRQGKTYGIGVTLQNTGSGVRINSIAWNSPIDKACIAKNIDPVGRVIKSVSDVDGQNLTIVNDYTEFSSAINRYDKSVLFNINLDGISDPVTVSREDFTEAYVRYYDNKNAYVFVSDYGKTPVGEEINSGKSELPDDTAYIEFKRFNGGASEQFAAVMQYLKTLGKSKLILDMRSNGGGYMDILTDVASYLINNNGKNNTLVATAKYKDGTKSDYSFKSNNYVPLDKLTVIANEYSASATECLIGALLTYGDLSKDNLVITSSTTPTGVNKTYGKGIMQTTFYGPKNNAIKLTTAYIYWPDGTTNIHGKGIEASLENSVLYEDGFSRALAVSND